VASQRDSARYTLLTRRPDKRRSVDMEIARKIVAVMCLSII
jgi:hypothetical protein